MWRVQCQPSHTVLVPGSWCGSWPHSCKHVYRCLDSVTHQISELWIIQMFSKKFPVLPWFASLALPHLSLVHAWFLCESVDPTLGHVPAHTTALLPHCIPLSHFTLTSTAAKTVRGHEQSGDHPHAELLLNQGEKCRGGKGGCRWRVGEHCYNIRCMQRDLFYTFIIGLL